MVSKPFIATRPRTEPAAAQIMEEDPLTSRGSTLYSHSPESQGISSNAKQVCLPIISAVRAAQKNPPIFLRSSLHMWNDDGSDRHLLTICYAPGTMLDSLPMLAAVILLPPLGGSYGFLLYTLKTDD